MFKSTLLIAALVFSMGAGIKESQAITIGVDTGWVDEIVYSSSEAISFDFTLATAGVLSLSDCCSSGDTWTIEGDIAGVSTVGLAPISFTLGMGEFYSGSLGYDTLWLDATYSHFQVALAEGFYSFTVMGDGAPGFPASFGVRVDALPTPVPLPAAGLLLFGALTGLGAISRRRKASKKA